MGESEVMNLGNWNSESGGFFRQSLQENLGSEFKGLLENSLKQEGNKDSCSANLECKNIGKHVTNCVKQAELSSRKRCRENDDDDDDENGDKKNCDDSLVLDSDCPVELVNSQKIQREISGEALSKMLNWVLEVAKCPYATSVGVIPRLSERDEQKRNECWVQAIRARQALIQRRKDESRNGSSLHQGLKEMHPSIHNADQQTKPMCSKDEIKTSRLRKAESKTLTTISVDSPVPNAKIVRCKGEFSTRNVAIGPLFQAEVPNWTKPISDSDSKWLGKRIWPKERGQNSYSLKNDLVGRGRSDSCRCDFRGSVECTRFHIAENRMKLKRELGPVFFDWKFQCMGEEISLRWTDREEKLFKNAVTSDSFWFWQNAHKLFPKKTRTDLLSYYFNVLLMNRRRYQNRVTPKDIDSDDDGTEFGCIGRGFGHEAVRALGSDIMICTQNFQCTSLD